MSWFVKILNVFVLFVVITATSKSHYLSEYKELLIIKKFARCVFCRIVHKFRAQSVMSLVNTGMLQRTGYAINDRSRDRNVFVNTHLGTNILRNCIQKKNYTAFQTPDMLIPRQPRQLKLVKWNKVIFKVPILNKSRSH